MKRLPLQNRQELADFAQSTADRMGESAIVMQIFTDNYKESIDGLLQFAIAMMLDKPIFLLVPRGVKIPEKVKRIMDGYAFFDPKDPESGREASVRLLKKAQEKGFVA